MWLLNIGRSKKTKSSSESKYFEKAVMKNKEFNEISLYDMFGYEQFIIRSRKYLFHVILSADSCSGNHFPRIPLHLKTLKKCVTMEVTNDVMLRK